MSDDDDAAYADDPEAYWRSDVTRRLEVLEEMLQELGELVQQIAGKPLKP